ncbi:MAG: glycosyltransferase family 2 protein [Alphaproteobacteria bacterium]|nr:glycosyltransferase family 2 protein [Alphaproteobacteria bacterium]
MKTLAIVIPCYNEEEALPACNAELSRILSKLVEQKLVSPASALYFVDDGSRDGTWPLIEHYAEASGHVHGIKLSGNRGTQRTIMAAITTLPCDMMVTIDADLQDDADVIEAMVRHHLQGAEIVYGVRIARDKDTFFKRLFAGFYYKVVRWLGIKIILNHSDYRLLGRAALDALGEYGEVNLFLRGIIPHLGFTAATVEYARKERVAGHTKYTPFSLLGFAWNGIMSTSAAPLRAIFVFGITVSLVSFLLVLYAFWQVLLTDNAVPGWASTVIPLFFLGGVQMLSIGIIGEYIGKIYMETKARPRFHIEKQV